MFELYLKKRKWIRTGIVIDLKFSLCATAGAVEIGFYNAIYYTPHTGCIHNTYIIILLC